MAKYGYRDITDITLIDLATGNPVIYMDYLQTTSQSYGSEIVYQKGGRGAPKLVGFQSENALTMEITSALLTPEMLGIMFGTDTITGVQNVPVTEVIHATTNTFALAATPVVGTSTPITVAYAPDGTTPKVHLAKVASTPTATDFSITGLNVTVNSATYASGGTFLVTYYKASTANNKRVSFQSDKFAKAYKVIGYTLWKNTQDEKLYPARVTIPKLQLSISGAQLNSAMNGEATTLKFNGEALKSPSYKDLVIYDIDEGEAL